LSAEAHARELLASVSTILEHTPEELLVLDVVCDLSHEDDRALGCERAVKGGLEEVHVAFGVDADVVDGKVMAAKGLVRLPDVLGELSLEVFVQVGGALLFLMGGPSGRVALIVRDELVTRQANLLFFVDEVLDDWEDTD
jgi:hypothetical protein